MRSVCRALDAAFLAATPNASCSDLGLCCRLAARRCWCPCPCHTRAWHPCPCLQSPRFFVVLLEVPRRVPAGHLTPVQVRLVAAAVVSDLRLTQFEFDHAVHRAGQELAVVADQ